MLLKTTVSLFSIYTRKKTLTCFLKSLLLFSRNTVISILRLLLLLRRQGHIYAQAEWRERLRLVLRRIISEQLYARFNIAIGSCRSSCNRFEKQRAIVIR